MVHLHGRVRRSEGNRVERGFVVVVVTVVVVVQLLLLLLLLLHGHWLGL